MYAQKAFRENRPEILKNFIRQTGFGTLVSSGLDGPQATHLPLFLAETNGSITLNGHVARNNPHWRLMAAEAKGLAIFLGPESYVTPQWYPTKLEHGRVVPTWNYISVHARGAVRAIEDSAWILQNLTDLTDQHEGKFPHQWKVTDAPREFIEKLVSAVVGIELHVEHLEGTWKLSQNRSEPDQHGVWRGLSSLQNPQAGDVAAAMPVVNAAEAR